MCINHFGVKIETSFFAEIFARFEFGDTNDRKIALMIFDAKIQIHICALIVFGVKIQITLYFSRKNSDFLDV